MKTKIFTLLATAVFVISAQHVQAKVRRVGFPGKAVPGTDFTSLQNAIDSSSAKDSIYIFPGSWSGNLSKRLVFEGYGSPQGDTALQVGIGIQAIQISVFPGSDSSIFEGLDGFFLNMPASVNSSTIASATVYGGAANNIIVRRCHISFIDYNDQILSNWVISQCIIDFWGETRVNGANDTWTTTVGGYGNLLVNNCIIYQIEFDATGWGPTWGISTGNGIFQNNIFLAQAGTAAINQYGAGQQLPYVHDFNNTSFIMQNNIFADSALYNISGLTWQDNVSTHADIPLINPGGSATGNKQNVANSSLFVGYPNQGNYTNDARYVLAAGSPAKGAGIGGVDCGAFGGTSPYKLDCIPALPAFFKLSAPSTSATANPYTITFSVRSNN